MPAGSQLVAQTSQAVITQNRGTPLTPWYGCLLATGQRLPLLHLTKAGQGFTTTLTQLQLAGRFAALATAATDASGHCANAVTQVDLAAGSARQVYTQNCTRNLKTVDSLALDTSGFTAWHAIEQVLSAKPLVGLSCPSSSLCVGVDSLGRAFATTQPPAGPWSSAKVAPALDGVVCQSAQLCIGLDGADIITSTNAGATTAAWSSPQVVDSWPISDMACPSSDLCIAVDAQGNVLSSTDPTGGPSAWTLADIDGTTALTGVSCPSRDLCVAVGQHGDVLTSSDPTGGAAAWTRSSAESSGAGLTGVACPSSDECVTVDTAGNVLTTTSPTAGLPWTATALSGLASTGLVNEPVCPRSDLCLIRSSGGDLFSSSDPTGGQAAWSLTHLVAAPNSLVSLACANDGTLCVAGDANGNVLSATNPTAGAAAWSTTPVDVPPCAPCLAEQIYASDDRATQALDTVEPGAGRVLGGVTLGGNSTTLTWTHAGATQSAGLS